MLVISYPAEEKKKDVMDGGLVISSRSTEMEFGICATFDTLCVGNNGKATKLQLGREMKVNCAGRVQNTVSQKSTAQHSSRSGSTIQQEGCCGEEEEGYKLCRIVSCSTRDEMHWGWL